MASGSVENVSVYVRLRPVNELEASKDGAEVVSVDDESGRVLVRDEESKTGQAYKCSAVMGQEVLQRDFYERCQVDSLIEWAAEGYAATIFAYGQTGSGKTFTMFGDEPRICAKGIEPSDSNGIIARSVPRLMQCLASTDGASLTVSAVEIYNDQVYDLLSGKSTRDPLHVRQRQGAEAFYVEDLTARPCPDETSAYSAIQDCLRARKTSGHRLNHRSSRGHCMVWFDLERPSRPGTADLADEVDPALIDAAALGRPRRGQLVFVDLAGSERLKDTESSGVTRSETGHINKSLFALGKVMHQLSKGKGGDAAINHKPPRRDRARPRSSRKNKSKDASKISVPFRESKLTMLLKSALGGYSRTIMIACCTPARAAMDESIRTLQFAMGVKRIRNHTVRLLDPQEKLVASLQHRIRTLREENEQLRTQSTQSWSDAGETGGGGLPLLDQAAGLPPPRHPAIIHPSGSMHRGGALGASDSIFGQGRPPIAPSPRQRTPITDSMFDALGPAPTLHGGNGMVSPMTAGGPPAALPRSSSRDAARDEPMLGGGGRMRRRKHSPHRSTDTKAEIKSKPATASGVLEGRLTPASGHSPMGGQAQSRPTEAWGDSSSKAVLMSARQHVLPAVGAASSPAGGSIHSQRPWPRAPSPVQTRAHPQPSRPPTSEGPDLLHMAEFFLSLPPDAPPPPLELQRAVNQAAHDAGMRLPFPHLNTAPMAPPTEWPSGSAATNRSAPRGSRLPSPLLQPPPSIPELTSFGSVSPPPSRPYEGPKRAARRQPTTQPAPPSGHWNGPYGRAQSPRISQGKPAASSDTPGYSPSSAVFFDPELRRKALQKLKKRNVGSQSSKAHLRHEMQRMLRKNETSGGSFMT